MTNSRRLAKNAGFNLLGQITPLVAALVSIPFLIKGLGPDRFGILGLAQAAIGYFGFVDLGLGRALTHAVASRLGSDEENELDAVGWTALLLMFALGTVGAIVLTIATPWLVDSVLKIPAALTAESVRSFYIMAASLPIVVSTAGLRGIIEGHQHFGVGTALRLPFSVLSYVAPLAVLPFSHRLDGVIMVLVLVRVLGWAAHFVFCVRSYWFLRTRVIVRRHVVLPLLRVGGWMTVSNVVSPLMVYLDRFLIGSLLSVAAVAYYVTPFEAVAKLLIVPSALVGVLFPAFAEAFVRNREATARLFDTGVRAVVATVFPAALVFVTLSFEILHVWVGPEFARQGSQIMQWLAAGVLINSIGFVGFSVLQGVGRPDLTGKLNLIELPLYIVAIWLLARSFGVVGVAVAWTLRVSVDTIAMVYLTRRQLASPGQQLIRISPVFWLTMLGLLVVGARLQSASARLVFAAISLAIYLPSAWRWLVTEDERRAVWQWLRRRSSDELASEQAA